MKAQVKRFHPAGLIVTMLTLSASWQCGRGSDRPPTAGSAGSAAVHDVDLGGMDRSIAPGDNFFAFANGTWMNQIEIPPDRSSAGIWSDLAEQALKRTRELLEHAAGGDAPAGSDERRIGDYYTSFMDEAAIDAKGTAPLADALKTVTAISDRRALAAWIGRALRTDVDPLNATELPHGPGLRPVDFPGRQRAYALCAVPAPGGTRSARSRILPRSIAPDGDDSPGLPIPYRRDAGARRH